ncbi:MAG: hypothetical protein JOY92_01850 [Verrucomicrobia bacterium]|nr:hypothetical protein [Verrucomicrobiota bacterium]
MLTTRKVWGPARFSRQLTQWGLTLLVAIALFLSTAAAYNLMVGEYSVAPAARRAVHPILVNGPQMPTPVQRRSDYPHPQDG